MQERQEAQRADPGSAGPVHAQSAAQASGQPAEPVQHRIGLQRRPELRTHQQEKWRRPLGQNEAWGGRLSKSAGQNSQPTAAYEQTAMPAELAGAAKYDGYHAAASHARQPKSRSAVCHQPGLLRRTIDGGLAAGVSVTFASHARGEPGVLDFQQEPIDQQVGPKRTQHEPQPVHEELQQLEPEPDKCALELLKQLQFSSRVELYFTLGLELQHIDFAAAKNDSESRRRHAAQPSTISWLPVDQTAEHDQQQAKSKCLQEQQHAGGSVCCGTPNEEGAWPGWPVGLSTRTNAAPVVHSGQQRPLCSGYHGRPQPTGHGTE